MDCTPVDVDSWSTDRSRNRTASSPFSKYVYLETNRSPLTCPPNQRTMLAYKFHQIGKSILEKTSEEVDHKAADATQWLQKAFSVADQLADEDASFSELKVRYSVFFSGIGHADHRKSHQISILRTMGM